MKTSPWQIFFESVLEFSYLGIFFLLILVNAAPLLMPPTWIILASFYVIDSSYDPLVLCISWCHWCYSWKIYSETSLYLFLGDLSKKNKNQTWMQLEISLTEKVWLYHNIISLLQHLCQVTCYL